MSDKKNKTQKPGWRLVRFGDVVTQVKDRVADATTSGHTHYVRGEDFVPAQIRLGSKSELGDGQHGPAFYMQFKKGDVLYVSRNPRLRKAAVADFDGICANTTYVCRSDTTILLQELLPFIMQTDDFSEYAKRHQRGSTNFYVNWSDIAPYEFALPPIDEQTTIVAILQASRAVPDAQSEALVKLQMLRQSIIDHLLRLRENGRYVRLEKVATMQNGRPFPGDEYKDEGVKLLRPGNLGASGHLSWLAQKTVYLDPSWETSAADFVIHTGDVVINLTAQSLEDGFMGRVCLAGEKDKSLLNQRVGRFRCNEDVLQPEFLFRCLQTSRFRLHAHAHCEGSKVKHMFWQHLAKYEIEVPDISVQEDVIAQCAEIDTAIKSLGSRLASSKRLAARLTSQLAGGT